MRSAYRLLLACLVITSCVSAYAENNVPKHAFKKTYDQILTELPNVRSQLEESDIDGMKRWMGNIPVGTASAVVQITGKNKDTINSLTVILIFTQSTKHSDYDGAEALRDVLFQGLLGRGDAFDLVNDFFESELDRQRPIIMAGGQPSLGIKKIAKGTAKVSLQLSRSPEGLIAYYSLKLL